MLSAGLAAHQKGVDAYVQAKARVNPNAYLFADANARWEYRKKLAYSIAAGIGIDF